MTFSTQKLPIFEYQFNSINKIFKGIKNVKTRIPKARQMDTNSQHANIQKLKDLVKKNNICLFCIDLKADDGASSSPMHALNVCDQGNIWFLSDVNSDKNHAIKLGNQVQLFFSHPGINTYFIVNGQAEIIIDEQKTEELWTSAAQDWFTEGKDDPDISIIKVKPQMAYYWDHQDSIMKSLFKKDASNTNTNTQ